VQSRWRPWELVEPGGLQDWRRQGGDHGDCQVARWRPWRHRARELTGAGRTRWRPQKENHKEVDRPKHRTGGEYSGCRALMERSLGSGMTRKAKDSSQKEESISDK
jgi:hypothetical protein